MRRQVERFAWRLWRGEAGVVGAVVGCLLLPAEGVWRLMTRLRNRRHADRVARGVDGLAVVSVGNVAVGGTGKTPFAAWVAAVLRDGGHRPAILLRGYGRDEVELHRTWNADVPVEVAADRLDAARAARDRGCGVAVLDDGFQHRGLGRVVDIALVAAADPVPGAVLPRGPYREPLSALRRADVVVVTRRTASRAVAEARLETLRTRGVLADGATLAGVRLQSGEVVSLARWGREGDGIDGVDDGDGRDKGAERSRWEAAAGVVAFTAIARPDAFQADVEELTGVAAELVAFPDHHSFSTDDVRRVRRDAGDRPVLVTEKDAVKLRHHVDVLGDAWVIVQRLVWDWGEDEVRARLLTVLSRETGAEA